VEIRSTDPAILSPMLSVHLAAQIDTPALTVFPSAIVPRDIARWKIIAANVGGNLADLTKNGAPGPEVQVPLLTRDLQAIGIGDDITMMMKLQESKGHSVLFSPGPVKVTYIKTSQRLEQKQDMKVQKKYALILFDFDKFSGSTSGLFAGTPC
jgi:hypothetical protein